MTPAPPAKLWSPLPRLLWGLLGVFACLGLVYNFVFPPFEPTDEPAHFEYVRYLIEKRSLPVAQTDQLTEFHQPPLYYTLAAALSWPFPAADRGAYLTQRVNPYRAFRYWEPGLDNKNLFLHGPWDWWPFQTTSLSVHVARLASLLLGLGTVFLTYQLAAMLMSSTAALAVTGLVAFLPMFLAISSSLQNDAGAAFMGALALWLGLRSYTLGLSTRRVFLLGLILGLGALMKLNVAVLLAPAGLMVFTASLAGQKAFRWRWVYLGLLLLAAAVSGGWWYLRNQQLYGEPTAVNVILEAYGRRTIAEGIAAWGPGLRYVWSSFWGRFGHTDVVLPQGIYDFLGGLTLLAGVGLALKLVRYLRRQRAAAAPALPRLWPYLFLALAGVAEFSFLLAYMTINPNGYMGRLVFPALSAYMLFLAAGLLELIPRRLPRYTSLGLPGAMLLFGAGVLPAYLIPVYTPPPALSALPSEAIPLEAHFGDVAILKGYSQSTSQAQPGDRVYITLYWLPLRRTAQPYSTYLHLLDQDGILVAQRDTYHGLGRAPTTAWIPGQMFADRYLVIIPETALAPVEARWSTGLWQKELGERAFVVDANGEPVAADVELGTLALAPRPGALPNPMDINFGGQVRLVGYALPHRVYSPGQQFPLTVYWKAENPTGQEQLRVRVMAENGNAWADASYAVAYEAQSVWGILAPDTPPGLYDLVISVTSNQEEVSMLAADGHKLEKTLRLTGIRVPAP